MTRKTTMPPAPLYTEETRGTTRVLSTPCPGCPRSYSIDEGHWDYARVKAALDRGDRSALSCYHRSLEPGWVPPPGQN